jgi:hypothetical protein
LLFLHRKVSVFARICFEISMWVFWGWVLDFLFRRQSLSKPIFFSILILIWNYP